MHNDDDWDEDDEDEGYIPCPYCGEAMLEDAEHCPSCNRWISAEDQPRKPLSLWMMAVVLLCLMGLILGAVVGF